VILGESRYVQTMKATDFLALTRPPVKSAAPHSVFLRETELQIKITGSQKVWIDNNLAKVRLQPALLLSGSAAYPKWTGRISVVEGTLNYLDHKFKLTKGTADFSEPDRINPIVDVEATTEIKGYQTFSGIPHQVTLTLKGPLDEIAVDLRSVPEKSKPDIVALLTFGATRDELTRSSPTYAKNGVPGIILDRAKMLSSRKVASTAENYLGNFLRLDQMSIEGNLFKFDKTWGPQLLASKRLSKRIALNYTTTVGHMNDESIRLEYQLSRLFSVEGQADRVGRSGIDLKYKIQFK
jgi:translocation and assembly module TamB